LLKLHGKTIVMNNLHLTLTDFQNESRILKETLSLLKNGVVKTVYVAALHADLLSVDQTIGGRLIVHRFNLMTRKMSKILVSQILKYFEFCFAVYFYYKNKKIKIINVHSLSLLPLGVALKYLYDSKLIYDTHELETEKNGDQGFRKKINKWVENFLINQVDITIVVSESIADWYQKAYSIARPPVIMNAPNRREIVKTDHFRSDLGIRKDQMIMLYQGVLAAGRGIDLILEAFQARYDDKVVVVFMGYGPLAEKVKNCSSLYKNIFYYPSVPPEVVLEYTSSGDVGLCLIENTCLSYVYSMPNKFFEYAMAGLPILTSDMKDMSKLINQYKMGSVVKEFTIIGINEAIDFIIKSNLKEIKINAYRVACEHAWEIQEEKLICAYKELDIYMHDDKMGEK
jgi:glycosyltransferase involved in cell wall biosynthesis